MSPEYEQTDVLDISGFFSFLFHRWFWFLVAVIVGCGGALALYHFTVKPAYKASAEIYITNSESIISYQDIQLSSALTIDYEEILLSRTVLKSVIRDLDLDIDYSVLKQMIMITNPDDSHCLVISTTADTKAKAINITNSLVKYGIDQIYRIVGKDQPSVIDSAEASAVSEVQASWKLYIFCGALAMLILTTIIFLMQFWGDTTLKSDEEIERYLNLNILAIIPEAAPDDQEPEGGNR